jgi:hypothetical protein
MHLAFASQLQQDPELNPSRTVFPSARVTPFFTGQSNSGSLLRAQPFAEVVHRLLANVNEPLSRLLAQDDRG